MRVDSCANFKSNNTFKDKSGLFIGVRFYHILSLYEQIPTRQYNHYIRERGRFIKVNFAFKYTKHLTIQPLMFCLSKEICVNDFAICWIILCPVFCVALQWRHNERDGVSNHQPPDCLFSRLFKAQIKHQRPTNIKAPCHWPLWVEFTGTGEFPAQRASNAENVSIWWRHHA